MNTQMIHAFGLYWGQEIHFWCYFVSGCFVDQKISSRVLHFTQLCSDCSNEIAEGLVSSLLTMIILRMTPWQGVTLHITSFSWKTWSSLHWTTREAMCYSCNGAMVLADDTDERPAATNQGMLAFKPWFQLMSKKARLTA